MLCSGSKACCWAILVGAILLLQLNLVSADMGVNPGTPRQCYACEGINCQRTTKTNVTSSCTDLLDICVTIFNEFEVLAKGCYLDMPAEYRSKCEKRNNPECQKCFGQLCNNKGRVDFKCIECNSKDNSKCATDTSAMTAVQCAIPTAVNSYCYVRSSAGAGISRGCFVHQQQQLACWNDADCSLCLSSDGEACNAYTLGMTAAASGQWLSFGAMITLLLAFLLR